MGRTARDQRGRPHPKPVERIELSEEHAGRRLLIAGLLLAFGAAMLAYAFLQLVSPGEEWITVEASSSAGASSAEEFQFLYRPGGGELSYTADRRAVTALYTRLCRETFELFHSMEEFEGVVNVCAVNRRPNEILEISPGFYEAFAAVERSGSRALYLGPVYERYDGLFSCWDDSQLADFDPLLNPEVAREYREYAAFANDPQAVRVELLGENRIRLYVSPEYLEYAGREGVERFIDFAWMRNAFIADYLARELEAQGHTRGLLASYDGFVRCLDRSGEDYSLSIYDRQEGMVCTAAVLAYQGPKSIVSLRDYPISALEERRFYRLQSGEIRTPYVDIADGMCRNAVSSLTGYAEDRGCGEILLEMTPVYIAGELREDALEGLAEKGIDFVYCEDQVIHASEDGAVFSQVVDGYDYYFRTER